MGRSKPRRHRPSQPPPRPASPPPDAPTPTPGASPPRTYRVDFKPSAARQLAELLRDTMRRVAARVQALAGDPRPPGVEPLAGEEKLYRVRVGDYRVIYQIHDDVLMVLVVKIGHRRDVYRHLP